MHYDMLAVINWPRSLMKGCSRWRSGRHIHLVNVLKCVNIEITSITIGKKHCHFILCNRSEHKGLCGDIIRHEPWHKCICNYVKSTQIHIIGKICPANNITLKKQPIGKHCHIFMIAPSLHIVIVSKYTLGHM